MSARPSRARIIATIIAKDFRAFSRDRLFLFLSILGLVFYVLIFWVIPSSVNESVPLGVVQTDLDRALERYGEQQDGALELVPFASRDELAAVIAGELQAWRTTDGALVLRDKKSDDEKPADAKRLKLAVGLAFPPDFVATTASGGQSRVELLVDVQAPPALETAMKSFVRELAYALSGQGMPVTLPAEQTIVLGEDRAGRQVPFRDRMPPMLALFMLMVEAMALATLIASEVSARTVTAVLSTPARASDLLLAKAIFGTLLASGQALLVLAAVGAFTTSNWHVLLVTVLIGGMLFSGCAMVAGAAGKDFMGTLFLSMVFILPMAVPSFAVLFPGQAGPLVQLMPSYGFIQVLLGVTAYAEPWSEQLLLLGTSCAWVVVLLAIGMLVLRRKVNTL
jgi:ABC-2 type transport system permease protein